MIRERRACRAAAVLIGTLAITGCQSLPRTGASGLDLDRAMPGEIARERHAHVTAALEALGAALSGPSVGLDGIPFDAALVGELPAGAARDGEAPAGALRRLAERDLMDAGPYRLVGADTSSGRLEYRSERTGRHLSVTVRAPRESEAGGKLDAGFVVTDMVGQSSLTALVRARPYDGRAARPGDGSSLVSASLLSASRLAPSDDAGVLARLDDLPTVEREREDLLGLRVMLELRLGRDDRARALVERGIVRYPDSPLHFALAERLFERADPAAGAPASLTTIVERRFGGREMGAARRDVERFLEGGAGA